MNQELKLNFVYHEDCLETLKRFPDNYFHSIVTDPPYGLSKQIDPMEVMKAWVNNEDYKATGKGFMGNEWDNFVPQPTIWKECLRVLRPGGYLLAFSSTRTQDWMAMALRFGGFEIVDSIMWVYGNGMPKFHNVGKMIDKKFGNEREKVGVVKKVQSFSANNGVYGGDKDRNGKMDITLPASEEAEKWEGFNPTVKPAVEPIIMARKPIEGTYVDNVLKWGCGALNIPATRVERSDGSKTWSEPKGGYWKPSVDNGAKQVTNKSSWTANLLHDGSEEVENVFPNTKSGKAVIGTGSGENKGKGIYSKKKSEITSNYADEGSASRFFNSFPFEATDRIIYTGKAKASEKSYLKRLYSLEIVSYICDTQNPNTICEKSIIHEAKKVLRQEDMVQLVQKDTEEFGVPNKKEIEWSIEWFTSNILAKFLKECKSTTKTESNWIIELKTLNWLHHLNTSESILVVKNEMEFGGNLVLNVMIPNQKQIITKANPQDGCNQSAKSVVYQLQLKISEKEELEKSTHPTVKPLKLMRHLVRLVTPPGGICYEPFGGSGTTPVACVLEKLNFVMSEREDDYVPIANARVAEAQKEMTEKLF